MNESSCWKCNEPLVEHGCPKCDENFIYLAKRAINRAKERVSNIDDALASFKKKIAGYRTVKSSSKISKIKDIGYAINTLCNIVDLLNEGNSHLIPEADLLEVQQKAQEIITCAQKLLDVKKDQRS